MRKVILSLSILVLTITGFAQAYEGTIEYNKKKQQAFVIEYPYSTEALENAIVARMQKLGYKGKSEKGLFNRDKGFIVFKQAYITEISDKAMDYVMKVEQKSRKDKETSVLYMVVMNSDENGFKTFDTISISRGKNFLNNLRPDVEAANLELQIRDQEEVLAKAEKKLRDLQDDKRSMEDKIRKLQADIKTNEANQDSAQKDILNQKSALEILRSKRML